MKIDYEYSGLSLRNTGGEISLFTAEGKLLDQIVYGPETVFPGKTTNLDATTFNPEANDFDNLWCEATAITESGIKGMPGLPNDGCKYISVTNISASSLH